MEALHDPAITYTPISNIFREIMEGRGRRYDGLYKKQSSGVWRSLRDDGDFQEEDVWSAAAATFVDREDSKFGNSTPSAARMIPRAASSSSSSSSSSSFSNNNSNHHEVQQSSAPVTIPDWSKIYGGGNSKNGSKNASWLHHDDDVNDYVGFVNDDDDDDDDDSDDEEHDCRKLPPHEWLSRRLARSQISSFSVFEGAGRTLKGRDLSKVRNAVLAKTGFLE